MMNNSIPSIRILPPTSTSPRRRRRRQISRHPAAVDGPGGGRAGRAATQVAQLLNGKGADVHSAMIAVEKADLSFQLMMQVRNKIVQAYQQISNMQF